MGISTGEAIVTSAKIEVDTDAVITKASNINKDTMVGLDTNTWSRSAVSCDIGEVVSIGTISYVKGYLGVAVSKAADKGVVSGCSGEDKSIAGVALSSNIVEKIMVTRDADANTIGAIAEGVSEDLSSSCGGRTDASTG